MQSNMIDTHAHVNASEFDDDRDDVMRRARESGVGAWIEVGTDIASSRAAIELAKKTPGVYASIGVHPDEIADLNEVDWKTLESYALHHTVCAIGEVGFDTFRDGVIADQEVVLRRFIALAQAACKPMIFHVRSGNSVDAHFELLRVLASYPKSELPRGVIHTFSGNTAQAKQYIELGMMISFSGVITFKNAGELPEIAKSIPLDSVLVETDCPFLTPEPHRGKRNEMAYVKHVIEKIADIRAVPFADVEKATEENAKNLFILG